MTFLDAALLVLSQADKPMTALEITDRALRAGFITTGGQTPDATMSAALYIEANRLSSRVMKIAVDGRNRARRGSVRWALSSISKGSGRQGSSARPSRTSAHSPALGDST